MLRDAIDGNGLPLAEMVDLGQSHAYETLRSPAAWESQSDGTLVAQVPGTVLLAGMGPLQPGLAGEVGLRLLSVMPIGESRVMRFETLEVALASVPQALEQLMAGPGEVEAQAESADQVGHPRDRS